MAAHEPRQRLEIAERWRTHPETVRIRRLAVAHDEVTELALRRFDRVIRFAGRRLDQTRHLADDGSFRNTLCRLADDAQRLAELLHAYEVAIVGVPGHADGDVEVHLVVGRVRFVLAHVARDARAAQRWTAEAER